MSDTRNHTTRDQLAAAFRSVAWLEYKDFDPEWAAFEDDVLDALEPVIAAVRAAAVAETTAAIEALLRQVEDDARENQHLARLSTRDVRAALSGGRTALNTTLAQARRQALLDAADHLDGTCTEMECGSPAHWAAAALRHRANEGSNQ